jgi:hypothetical protein
MALCPLCLSSNAGRSTLEGGDQLYDCERCGHYALSLGLSRALPIHRSLTSLAQDWIFFENLHGKAPLIDQSWQVRAKAIGAASQSYSSPNYSRERALIRPFTHDVARRRVVTDPNFATGVSRDCAAQACRFSPDNLRVMPTHGPARVRAIIEILCLAGPCAYHLRRRSRRASDLVEILAVDVIRAMRKAALRKQSVGPLLGVRGQLFGPDQGRRADPLALRVVRCQQLAR